MIWPCGSRHDPRSSRGQFDNSFFSLTFFTLLTWWSIPRVSWKLGKGYFRSINYFSSLSRALTPTCFSSPMSVLFFELWPTFCPCIEPLLNFSDALLYLKHFSFFSFMECCPTEKVLWWNRATWFYDARGKLFLRDRALWGNFKDCSFSLSHPLV